MQAISSPRSLDFEEIKSVVIGKQALLAYFQKRHSPHQKPIDDKVRDQTLKFAGGSVRIWSKNSATNFRLTFLHREEVKFVLSETAPAEIIEVAVRTHNNATEALSLDQYLSLSAANKHTRAKIPHKGSSINDVLDVGQTLRPRFRVKFRTKLTVKFRIKILTMLVIVTLKLSQD